MKKNLYDFDLVYDFREVHELIIKEKLSAVELEEGLEPEEIFLKVCLTKHAYTRIYDNLGRQCDWGDIEDLILEKGHLLFDMKTNEEFAIRNSEGTLVLICKLYPYNGDLVLILETVIRKVIMIKGIEFEKIVTMPKDTKLV